MIEGKNRPPFGFKTKRFLALGYHPHFETRPGTYKLHNIFPGRYDPKVQRKIICQVPRWKRQQEIEEFSRRLSYKGEHIVEALKWMKSINGPGWQDVPSDLLQHGIKFSRSARFPVDKLKSFAVAGPGTYGKNHDPFIRKEEKSRGKGFSFSNVPSFEHYSFASRSLTSERPYNLPPNLYKTKSFIDELLSKRTSKKGPYQLFTTERFPNSDIINLSPLSIYKNPLDLSHPQNFYKGKFYKCGKDCIVTSRLILHDISLADKKSFNLGPGSYDPYYVPIIKQARAPFNSSVPEVRPVLKCGTVPPPGRYNPISKRRILGDGMKSAFLSKTKRDIFKINTHSWFKV